MARNFATYIHELTLGASGPETVFQIVPATNHPVVLHNVLVGPRGVTAASAPMRFKLLEQSDAGGLADDSAALAKIKPAPSAALQMSINKSTDGAEPSTTGGGQAQEFTVHQQASHLWVPQNPFREMLVDTGERLGFVYLDDVSLALVVCAVLEE